MIAKLVSEYLNEYNDPVYDNPWEDWRGASKYIVNILKKYPDLSLDQLIRQCRGWVNNMSEKSRKDFLKAVYRLEKMTEAFDQDSDPIKDMKIGIKDVDDYVRKRLKKYDLEENDFWEEWLEMTRQSKGSGDLIDLYLETLKNTTIEYQISQFKEDVDSWIYDQNLAGNIEM